MTTTGLMERLRGRSAAGVPRWAMITAYLTTLPVLPPCIWRIASIVFGVETSDPVSGDAGGYGVQVIPDSWSVLYVIGLSVVSEAFAFLAVGLVCRWGEVFPR